MLQVSFYSYKGGAGRSTTSWNTIQRLVKLMKPTVEEPFVIVDTDTESAGSTFLYKAENPFLKNSKKDSVQKRIKNGEDYVYPDVPEEDRKKFFKGMYPIGTYFGLPRDEEEAVLFIGADLDKSSREDMRALDIDKENSGQMVQNFGSIRIACKYCKVKALFFDTPSGTQDLARLSIKESDVIVCCMRPTNQFREGTMRQLKNFIEYDRERDDERKYILTPTVICVDSEQKFVFGGEEHNYPQKAKDDIKKAFGTDSTKGFKENVILDMLEPTPEDFKEYPDSDDNDAVFGIPEVKRFKWFEECLGRLSDDELSKNDKMALRRYEYLAQTILKYGDE